MVPAHVGAGVIADVYHGNKGQDLDIRILLPDDFHLVRAQVLGLHIYNQNIVLGQIIQVLSAQIGMQVVFGGFRVNRIRLLMYNPGNAGKQIKTGAAVGDITQTTDSYGYQKQNH